MKKSHFLRVGSGILLIFAWLSACNFQAGRQGSSTEAVMDASDSIVVEQPYIADTAEPALPAEVNLPLNSGTDQVLSPEACFDLDQGQVQPLEDADCDFAIQSTSENNSLDFLPLSLASFAFSSVFWEVPTPEACQSVEGLSNSQQRINTAQPYYVCYQTGEGYLGYFYLKVYENTKLTIDWETFNQQTALLAEQPAIYPSQPQDAAVKNFLTQGVNQWVEYGAGIDLDNYGQVIQADGFDLAAVPGIFNTSGELLDVALKPQYGAVFSFSSPLSEAPDYDACLSASYADTTAQLVNIHRYFCYRTERNRLGYLYIHEVNPGVGVRIDWFTWTGSVSNVEVANEPETTLETTHRAELFAVDEPVPVFVPGRKFTQTWQLVNTGETTWSSLFALVFSAGNPMEGAARQNIRFTVKPGDDLKVSLNLVAPPDYGTYIGEYWLEDTAGNRFGVGEDGSQPLRVLVNVGEPGLTLAEGSQMVLPAGACFDLDLGYIAVDDPACDLYVTSSMDMQMVQISAPQAALGFNELLVNAPRLGQCNQARLRSGSWILDVQNWYVCYKTDQGRFGWLYLRDMDASQLFFDWKTFQ